MAASAAVNLPRVVRGRMVRRLNRFLALVVLDGENGTFGTGNIVEAHVPSSGRMGELLYPGSSVWVSHVVNAKRSTSYSVLIAEQEGFLVSVDSHLPNRLAERGLVTGDIRLHDGSAIVGIHRETLVRGERLDFLVETESGHTAVEVKSVTLSQNGIGYFPDAPTTRGTRQVRSLISLIDSGINACVIILVQRQDVNCFKPHDRFDPEFGRALRDFSASGGLIRAYRCWVDMSLPGVGIDCGIPVIL